MRKQIIYYLAVAAIFLSLGIYLGTTYLNIQTEEIDKPEKQEGLFDSSLITDYFTYSFENNWNKLFPILSGEALLNAESNLSKQMNDSSLLEQKIINYFSVGDYTVAEVALISEDKNGLDELYYRLYLYKDSIFKVTQLPFIAKRERLKNTETAETNFKAKNLVLNYLSSIEKNEWKQALSYLTGPAKQSGQKAVGMMPDVSALQFTKKAIKTIGTVNDIIFVEADYLSDGTLMKVLFELTFIKERPFIREISIVQTGSAGEADT